MHDASNCMISPERLGIHRSASRTRELFLSNLLFDLFKHRKLSGMLPLKLNILLKFRFLVSGIGPAHKVGIILE